MYDLEHPDITAVLITGYPRRDSCGAYTCTCCGCAIREDEPYYDIADGAYCPDCVEEAKRYG